MPDDDTDVSTVDQPTAPAHANRARATTSWDASGGPVTREDVAGRDKSEVAQPTPADLGPVSRTPDDVLDDVLDADEPVGDEGEVPETASAVVAWIKAGDNEAESTRRAGLAWQVESQRDDGVRSTVEDEVDRWLASSDSSDSGG